MNLSVLLILFFIVFILIPIFGDMKFNLRMFFSFLLSILINFGIFRLLKSTKFFNAFNHIYDKGSKYFQAINISKENCISIFNFLFIFIIFLITWMLICFLFKIIFKDRNFYTHKSLAKLITVSIFRILNCFCVLIILIVFLACINQFWEFQNGIFDRYFKLVLDLVYKI